MKKIIIALSILLFSFIYLSKSKDEKIVLHTNKRKKNSSNIEKIQIDKTVFKNHTKQFTNQGWKKAETTAPDENLVGLSLNLDEKLLANQISSNIFSAWLIDSRTSGAHASIPKSSLIPIFNFCSFSFIKF